ncbi:unnamed protein product [Trichobilharzia szidati]|nr:unnamed protein product [Trichobilharzia szidati]
MTVEGNSLIKQMLTLASKWVNAKARLLQFSEDNSKTESETVKYNEPFLKHCATELTKSVLDTKREHDKLNEQLSCLENQYANTY